jgi:hypothetical protein
MPQPVDMFGPDGQVHEVQQGDMQAAMQSGGELAHQLQGPDGQVHYVRHSQLGEALKSGGIPVAAIHIPVQQPEFVSMLTGGKEDPLEKQGRESYDKANGNVGMPGTTEGPGMVRGLAEYDKASGGEIGGGVHDIAKGNISKGLHRIISGTANATAPAAALVGPAAVAAAPAATTLSVGGGIAGSKLASAGANALGATPDQSELAGDVGGLVGGLGGAKLSKLVPSATNAGKLFQQASAKAGNLPVDISGAGNAALRAQELAENGAKMPTLLNKFLKKATAPGTDEMNFDTARDFYSNAGQQSIMQRLTTSPVMKRQIAQFRGDLGGAIQYTADQAGVGTEYRQALQEYRQAMIAKGISKAALLTMGAMLALKAGHAVLGGDAVNFVQKVAAAVP